MFTITAYSLQKTPLKDVGGMLRIIRKDADYLDAVVGVILVTLGSLAFTGVLAYSSLTQGIFLTLGSCSLVPAFSRMINEVADACRKRQSEKFEEKFLNEQKNPVLGKANLEEDSSQKKAKDLKDSKSES